MGDQDRVKHIYDLQSKSKRISFQFLAIILQLYHPVPGPLWHAFDFYPCKDEGEERAMGLCTRDFLLVIHSDEMSRF